MKRLILKNCDIFNGNEIMKDGNLLVEDDKVNCIFTSENEMHKHYLEDADIIDAKGALITPAFIDLQVNGGGGELLTDNPTPESLKIIRDAHEKFGVLNFMPTLISTDINTIKSAILSVKKFNKAEDGVIGLHLEGPYLEPQKSGIHNEKFIHNATIDELNEIYQGAEDIIKMVTIAPEACNIECATYMINKGTKVFIGHSNAGYDITRKYFDCGIIGVTHIFNAMSQLNSREPGIVGACFNTENVWAGLIADGFHVSFPTIKIAKKIKKSKIFLVTDAMPPVGLGDLNYKIGDTEIHCRDGKCLSNAGTIAGSALNMNKALQNAVNHCSIDLVEALKMTSTYQAEMLGVSNEYGNLKKGCYADIIALDIELNVVGIIRRGKVIKWNL